MTLSPYCLNAKSDAELLANLLELHRKSNEVTAELLAHLCELDARRLYLLHAAPSLFTYCVERLGCSEDEAGRRIHAARAARRFPRIFGLLAQGKLHLSTINLLAPHLDEHNADELIDAACGKTKRETEELIAARFAKPDVPTRLRALPLSTPLTTADAPASLNLALSPAAAAATPTASPAPASTGVPATSAVPEPRRTSVDPRASVSPLSSQRFKLQVTVSRQARDLLLRAQALLSHQVADGDLGLVLERALTLACEELERRKFAKLRPRAQPSTQPQRTASQQTPSDAACEPQGAGEHVPGRTAPAHNPSPKATPDVSTTQHSSSKSPSDPPRASRYLPRALRREVAERDGHRCAYVDALGRRCTAVSRLEFHHLVPYAKSNEPPTASMIQIRCRAHNDLAARQDFGEAHMAAAKHPPKAQLPTSRQSQVW